MLKRLLGDLRREKIGSGPREILTDVAHRGTSSADSSLLRPIRAALLIRLFMYTRNQ